MVMRTGSKICRLIVAMFHVSLLMVGSAGADMVVYDDALRNGWQNWSWGTYSLTNTTPVHAGTYSISFGQNGWEAVYFHRDGGVSGSEFERLDFWIHGGTTGGQAVSVQFFLDSTTLATVSVSTYLPGGPVANEWRQVGMVLADHGLDGVTFDGVWFWIPQNGTHPTVYLDDIVLIGSTGPTEPVTVSCEPSLDRRWINPHIYGVYLTDPLVAGQPAYPVRRWGGNHTTRYSWEHDVSNRASDWFYINYVNPANVPDLPNGSTADRFIDDTFLHGSTPLLTVPIIGWTPTDRQPRWGFSVARYGTQEWNECSYSGYPSWCNADAGNGNYPNGTPIVGNDPLDTSRAIGPSFVTDWMTHLANRLGWAADGGLRFFALDNEPMLWNSTHRDVHPDPVTYAEIWSRTQAWAAAMKALDSNIMLLGPVVWGWCAYFYSAADGCTPGADYAANGPFLEWYLQQIESYRQTHGVRLVDYLDIHYYPQADGVALSDDESEAAAARRLRSTRSLYDPAYTDESWIGQPVRLIPRMRQMIDSHAPGTRLAITEYNWGNDGGISSALAQVEVLAIFGREGVDMACRWVAPEPGTPVEDAFRVFLDYDGNGNMVAGDSVRAVSSDVDRVGAYAIRGENDEFWLVVINKTTIEQSLAISVNETMSGNLSVYGFDAISSYGYIGTESQTNGQFSLTLPPRGVRLAVGQLDCPVPLPVEGVRIVRTDTVTMTLTWTNVDDADSYIVYEDVSPQGTFQTVTGSATDGTIGLPVTLPVNDTYYKIAATNSCGTGPR